MKSNIHIEDSYYVNDDIEKLKQVISSYYINCINDLSTAYYQAEGDYWFYNLLKSSGLFSVFKTFDINDTNIVKNILEYNNNPSYFELEKIIGLLIPKFWITINKFNIEIEVMNSDHSLPVIESYQYIMRHFIPFGACLNIVPVDNVFVTQELTSVYSHNEDWFQCHVSGQTMNVIVVIPAPVARLTEQNTIIKNNLKQNIIKD